MDYDEKEHLRKIYVEGAKHYSHQVKCPQKSCGEINGATHAMYGRGTPIHCWACGTTFHCCRDCNAPFYLTDKQVASFNAKGLHQPTRCKKCREKRRA